ncbi:hypothetical protein PLICRDRAFT_124464 [Plicaturopsis crispa FD-325 SS-3]|nr:hypothetical protein PLICRDRAFT_124464 [Plicaturopsis crispa FD-325 SS-3]
MPNGAANVAEKFPDKFPDSLSPRFTGNFAVRFRARTPVPSLDWHHLRAAGREEAPGAAASCRWVTAGHELFGSHLYQQCLSSTVERGRRLSAAQLSAPAGPDVNQAGMPPPLPASSSSSSSYSSTTLYAIRHYSAPPHAYYSKASMDTAQSGALARHNTHTRAGRTALLPPSRTAHCDVLVPVPGKRPSGVHATDRVLLCALATLPLALAPTALADSHLPCNCVYPFRFSCHDVRVPYSCVASSQSRVYAPAFSHGPAHRRVSACLWHPFSSNQHPFALFGASLYPGLTQEAGAPARTEHASDLVFPSVPRMLTMPP